MLGDFVCARAPSDARPGGREFSPAGRAPSHWSRALRRRAYLCNVAYYIIVYYITLHHIIL